MNATDYGKRTKVTPPQIAEAYGCDVEKIHEWIRSGELRAINAATKLGQRPRYLVDLEDLKAFEDARAVTPPAPREPRRRKATTGQLVRHFR